MSLFLKLNEDMKTAMKGGDKARLEAVRYARSLAQNAEKEKQAKQPGATLTDDEVVAVLQKEAKRRKEALALFRQGGRADLVEKEEADLAVISEYIPKELSIEELVQMVEGLQGQGAKDYNTLMRETMKLVKGRADGKTVGEVVKKTLG